MYRTAMMVPVILFTLVACVTNGSTDHAAGQPITWTTYVEGGKTISCPGAANDVVRTQVSAELSGNKQDLIKLVVGGKYEEVYAQIRPHLSDKATDKVVSLELMCRAYVEHQLPKDAYMAFYKEVSRSIAGLPEEPGKAKADTPEETKTGGIVRLSRTVSYEITEPSPANLAIVVTSESEVHNGGKSTAVYVASIRDITNEFRVDGIWTGQQAARNKLGGCDLIIHSGGEHEYQCPQQEIPAGKSLYVRQQLTYRAKPLAHFSYSDIDVSMLPTTGETKLSVKVPGNLAKNICVTVSPVGAIETSRVVSDGPVCGGGTWKVAGPLREEEGFKVRIARKM